MKKLFMLLLAIPSMALFSCHNDSNVNIEYKDKNDVYSMDASFEKNKMHAVESYMDDRIGKENGMSFYNTTTDAVFTLTDGSKFSLKKSSGHIHIEIKKEECSGTTFHKLKSMCEGLKEVIVK